MIYLASPYTHSEPEVMRRRCVAVSRVAAYMISRGRHVYSPIAYGHHLTAYGIPGTWEAWEEHDKHMICLSDHVQVLMLPGYKESKGIDREVAYAAELGKTVFYTAPWESMIDENGNLTDQSEATIVGIDKCTVAALLENGSADALKRAAGMIDAELVRIERTR
jgi:hypothetical protein